MHALDVVNALSYCLDTTKPFRSSPRLFVAVADRVKGQAMHTQRLSTWMSNCIRSCYELARLDPPRQVRAHSTRTQALLCLLYEKHISFRNLQGSYLGISL